MPNTVQCPRCVGVGTVNLVPSGTATCPRCAGTGVITPYPDPNE